MSQVPIRYLPQNLSNKDKKIVSKELRKSRKAYKKGKTSETCYKNVI